MSARMGVVTGKGLSDLIRERFGVKVTVYVLIGLVLTNFGNVIAEFAGAAFILLPGIPLFTVMYVSQVVNGVVLPVVLVFMLRLINNRKLMGDHVNSRPYNVLAWATAAVLIALTLVYLGQLLGL